MSKFEGLEGIVKIYETSDNEEIVDIDDSEKNERRDSISNEDFTLASSRLFFENKMINAGITDFSDRIDQLASYETYSIKETVQNRLNRIRKELEEIAIDIQNDEYQDTSDLKEVEKLEELFKDLNQKSKNKKLSRLHIERETADNDSTNSNIQFSNASHLIEIDTKISSLEKTLGNFNNEEESVTSLINKIFTKFKILSNDKETLSKIGSKIDQVNEKFDKSLAIRRGLSVEEKESSVDDFKINEIYKNFVNSENLISELPYLIKRLESLHELQLQSASNSTFLLNLDHNLSAMESDFQKWGESLKDLEQKLEQIDNKLQ
ncbi:hypothetical protein WICMUC_000694 [Wickerhamomyces mucosus]|uniref:Uncharacterized protein n=1 Tax=Wickerhamomyces mucosus TaxID=1378264 RepID=A0A9P8TID9_9ASCO|nr:hypothetical protein WICMUC_000694 [Wickerhamomyces mucosus]